MALKVFLSSTLRKHIADYEPSHGIRMEGAAGMTVKDLCIQLKIPLEKIKIIMINGRSAGFNNRLNEGERVALFPPVGGG